MNQWPRISRNSITAMLAIPMTMIATIALAAIALACSNTIIWNGERGNWHDQGNWSGGTAPTATDCAVIADADTVEITQPSAICDELTVGESTGGMLFIWPGGDLTVQSVAYLGSGSIGSVGQVGGLVNLERLEVATGSYALGAGTLTCGSVLVGTAAVQGAVNVTGGTWIVDGTLELDSTALVTFAGGNTTIGHGGSGGILLGGWLSLGIPFGSLTAESFTVEPGGVLQAFISNLGLVALEVLGTATLDATLQVIDFGAADGRYEILTSGNLQGNFTTVQLPNENWSWGIEDGTVYVTKGSGTPVQAMSLSEVKHLYR